MPYVEGAPKELNELLERVYNDAKKRGATDASAAKIAWTAAKNAGWVQKDGKWVKQAKHALEDIDPETIELTEEEKALVARFGTIVPADLYDVNDVEIFATGTWHGRKYTEKDLDELVANHNALMTELQPFLKIGHSEDQEMAQAEGIPAVGWVTQLKRAGNKLLASFKGVPRKVKELIELGAYKRISAEIYFNYKAAAGKVHRMALRAVALMGGETPEVRTLDDIIGLYESREQVAFAAAVKGEIYNVEYDPNQGEKMDEVKELKEKIEKLEKENGELKQGKQEAEQKTAEAEAAKEEAEGKLSDAEKKEADAKAEKEKEEVEQLAAKAVDEGRLTPAQKPMLVALACDIKANDEGIKKFSYQDGEKVAELTFKSNKELVETLLASFGKQVDLQLDSKKGEKKDQTDQDTQVEKYSAAAKKLMSEDSSLTYLEAMKQVVAEDAQKE